MIPFSLKGEYIELSQLLKATGLAETGGQAGQAITGGLVRVDGQIEKRKGCKIRSGQKVEFGDHTVLIQGSG